MSNECDLGGRTGWRTPANSVHYFGSFGTPPTLSDYPDFVDEEEETWSAPGSKPRLWLVGCAAREVLRYDEDPSLAPLRGAQVRSLKNIPVPFSWRDDTQLKLRIGIMGGPKLRPVYMDVGQQLEVVAADISVRAVLPSGWVEVGADPSGIEPQAGLVGDVLFGAWATEIEESLGLRQAQFTQTLYVAAEASGSLRIPPGARELQVFASGNEAALPELRFYQGDPNVLTTGYRIGAMTFDTNTFQTKIFRVPSATHVVTESVGNAVFLTFVWTIRP